MKNLFHIFLWCVFGGVFTQTGFAQSTTSSLPVRVGDRVAMYAISDGYPAPTFAWFKDGVRIPGATNSTFVISRASLDDAGAYTVVATNEVGSAVSLPEILIVERVFPREAVDTYEVVSFWKNLRRDIIVASILKYSRVYGPEERRKS